MKKISILLSTSIFLALTGCMPKVEKQCGYALDYQHRYYDNANCGPRIFHRCDPICNICSSRERECAACWSCIKSDDCY